MEKEKRKLGNIQAFSKINSVADGIRDRNKAVNEILNPNSIRGSINDRNKAFDEIFEPDKPKKPDEKKSRRGY